MILDKQLVLSDAQAVTTTANSSNVLDVGLGTSPVRQAFVGEPMWIVVQMGSVAATASGAATVTIAVVQADDAALTTNVTTLHTTSAIGKATLVAGYRALAVRPAVQNQRYLGVTYTVATGPLTAGTFNAFLVKDADFQQSYASGFANAF